MKLHTIAQTSRLTQPIVARVATQPVEPSLRQDAVLLWNSQERPDSEGFAAVLTAHSVRPGWQLDGPVIWGAQALDYLSDGDVVSFEPGGFMRVLYRRRSEHNTLLLTEQCNSYCLMCSQPPRADDDRDRLWEHFRTIELIDPATAQLGFTGGEPTLLKDDFLRLIAQCKERLPNTALHVLTNGRLFYYRGLARQLGEIAHPQLVLGIPLYSDIDTEHDYVVQARGAYEQTVLGLLHLDEFGVAVEIRVVVHGQTYRRLPQLAEFITRNFPFAVHVALMGLEMFGFVHWNLSQLWIDPKDYQTELRQAVEVLAYGGMDVSIYNHQLCVLDRDLWPFARKSISDWKNIYLPECESCAVKAECGGFFASAAKRHSRHIEPLREH